MKTQRLFLAVLLLFSVFAMGSLESESAPEADELPKMPVYLGLGYNIIEGNPLSNYVDTGFGHPIFKATYKHSQKTSDNRYLIPDYVTHRIVSSCSFSSSVSEHRGTESYQKSILDTVTTKAGMATAILQASFSKSRSYQVIEKSTIQNKESITQAAAECEAYYLSVDLFRNFALEDSFEVAVNASYHSNNWDTFIEEYGTHFVKDVTMGGRALQEISYTSQSVSKLNSLDIDISTAARARFAQFFGDRSTDWEKYEEQIRYSSVMTNKTTELYIGGHPPRDGDVRSWIDNVINNPMPIRYSVIELTELFDKVEIFGIKTNLAKVKKSFVTALVDYCHKIGCKKPIDDLPKPGPAKVELENSPPFGGPGGMPFQFVIPNPLVNVKSFLIHAGNWVNTVQMLFTDGVKSTYSPAYGTNTDASFYQWDVPEEEFVSQVEFNLGTQGYLGGFNLITNKGHKSPRFGTTKGFYGIITFPEGYRIIGLYGKSGSFVDQMGFVLGKTIYPEDKEYASASGEIVKVDDVEKPLLLQPKVKILRVELA